jgi:hypothetical protein
VSIDNDARRERIRDLVAEHRARQEEFDAMIQAGIDNPRPEGPIRHRKASTPWWRRLFQKEQ